MKKPTHFLLALACLSILGAVAYAGVKSEVKVSLWTEAEDDQRHQMGCDSLEVLAIESLGYLPQNMLPSDSAQSK